MVQFLRINGWFSLGNRILPLLFLPFSLSAQNLHERTWFFGQGHSLHFNNGVATPGGIPPPAIYYDYNNTGNGINLFQIAVSNAAGALQFFVQIESHLNNVKANAYAQDKVKVFDRQGRPFPNGNIFANGQSTGATSHVGTPLAIPYPGQPQKYILFHKFENSIRYSIINMDLNNGYGDVELSQKDIILTGYNSIIGYKMTTIPACDGVWLVARSLTSNQYYSFKIDEQGVHKEYVISNVGSFPIDSYKNAARLPGGILKASNDGLLIAAATGEGIELYDFEPCSGQLKNARIIDTLPAYGLCFSPDDTKLYASYDGKRWGILRQGEIFQYDVQQPTNAAIAASRTLVMRNPIYEVLSPLGPVSFAFPLGELKLGPDQKIYVSKNNDLVINENWLPGTCYVLYPGPDHDPVPLPAGNNCLAGQYMHVIHQPNNKGTSSLPELDYLKIDPKRFRPGYLLQNDIKTAPSRPPDTTTGKTIPQTVCFSPKTTLVAKDNVACYLWDNGQSSQERSVDSSGTYWVGYFKNCTYQRDTYLVSFIELPQVPDLVYGCPGEIQVAIRVPENNQTVYHYTLTNDSDSDTFSSKGSFSFQDLSPGTYTLRIQTYPGCDTMLYLQLEGYPVPDVSVNPEDTIILYGDAVTLKADGAQQYNWLPVSSLEQDLETEVIVRPLRPTLFLVVGRNPYGCKDTAYVNVRIDYSLPDGMPNAFSPNGDGHNDVFKVSGLTYQKVVYFRVFNRFGQEVYVGFNNEAGWDGKYKEQPCDIGTYYYQVELLYPDGKRKMMKGDVVLLR